MSRVTNSILLRFGITSFWSSFLFNLKTKYLLLTLNFLFYLVLNNNFLQIIKTQYSIDSVLLYVLKFNSEKFSFLEKYLFLQKTKLNSITYRKNYSVKLLFNKKEKIVILTLKKIQYVTCLYLYTSLTFTLNLLSNNVNPYFIFLPLVSYILKKKKNKFFGFKSFKIKKLNYFIKLKLLGIFISDLIFNYSFKTLYINIKTITESIQFAKLPFFFNKSVNTVEKKQTFFRLILSFIFFTTKIISYDINKLIITVRNKKHISALKSYLGQVKILFFNSITSLKGIKIQIAGRLNGKLRKSRFGYVLGSVKLMSLTTDCTFSLESIYTQYGVFSLKIWFSH